VSLVVGILGLGEAGGAIAADLRASDGVRVRGWDPLPATGPDVDGPSQAVAGVDVVLSLTTAAQAEAAARSVLGALRPGQLYADLNTSAAARKRRLAALVEPTGARFADVALMAPVPGLGLRTPALACGSGADGFAAALGPLGMPIELVGAQPGVAAARKLLRSVVWKGLAAVIVEGLQAARAAGCEPWMEREIASLLEEADAELMQRMVSGSRRHAARRMHEMEDAAAQLRELGVPPRVTQASVAWLRDLREESDGGPDGG
jgi:3-hydroxyisobutyrate dehydrogenase-like beta-hydroxyacid dehydrogenase